MDSLRYIRSLKNESNQYNTTASTELNKSTASTIDTINNDQTPNYTTAPINSSHTNCQVRTIEDLGVPAEIWNQIFSYFNKRELSPVNSTCQVWNGIVKQIRTREGLDFAQELNLPAESVVETIKMLGAGYSNAYTYMSLYGFNELSDDQFKDIINSLYSGGFTMLKTVYLSKRQLNTFAKIRKELDLKEPIPTIEFIQDPRELYKADIYKQLVIIFEEYDTMWSVCHRKAKRPLGRELEMIIDKCLPLKVCIDTKIEPSKANIHSAVENNNLNVVKQFIMNGFDINVRVLYDCTLLCTAIMQGHISIANILIANGADVNTRDRIGCTPLVTAIDRGYMDIVNILIANGAHVNINNSYGHTPLSIAMNNRHAEMIELLKANGAI